MKLNNHTKAQKNDILDRKVSYKCRMESVFLPILEGVSYKTCLASTFLVCSNIGFIAIVLFVDRTKINIICPSTCFLVTPIMFL